MIVNSRIAQSKDYQTGTLRQNYNSIANMKNSASSQRLEQIRKKYDTPNRKQTKENYSNNKDVGMGKRTHLILNDFDLRKSINSTTTAQVSQLEKGGNRDIENYCPSPYQKESIKGEEEAVFRKIKEMKDSLINKSYNDKIRTTKSIYEPRANEKQEIQASLLLSEHRVQNIDKINSKIQQILNCLRQNQTKSSVLVEKDYKNESIPVHSRQPASESKIFSRIKVNQTELESRQPHVQPRSSKPIVPLQRKYEQATPNSKSMHKFPLNSNRSQTLNTNNFISSIHRQRQAYRDTKYEMKSGKKLDDEINKIESKIQQFEEEKRKLNIDFKPYSYSQSKSTSNLNKRSYTISKFERPTQPEVSEFPRKANELKSQLKISSKSYQRASFEPNQRSYRNTLKENQITPKNIQTSDINIEISKVTERPSEVSEEQPLFKIKLIPVQQERKSITGSKVQERFLNEELKRKADEGIMERKKKIADQISIKKRPTIKALVQKLSEQARLDEIFRNNKLWLESNLDPAKWTKLQRQLKDRQFNFSKQQVKSLFTITDEENNPFFSVRESSGNIQSLVTSFIDSQQHWKRTLYKNFSRNDLVKDQFSTDTLDLEKKGFIVLEDLVRFLNMETGTFYRNRDIYLIYRRISQKQKITFATLLQTLCK